jgi:parallel beta-helix repeat protein
MAVRKTGHISDDTWSGIILITGDLEAGNLIIEPGTIVFVEADKDDQRGGPEQVTDPVNPHEFLGKDYSKNHVSIRINGKLAAAGTPEKPIIITSSAEKPQIADWDYISIKKGILEYAVMEYGRGISLESSDTKVSHCLIRDVLGQGLMFGTWPEAGIYGEPVSPNITYNYMYNFGHMAVQSFFSEPYLAHNIFIHKNTDKEELYDYLNLGENGALDIHGGGGIIEYNFLSYGYNSLLEKQNELGGAGIGITEADSPVIRLNTIVGNKWGIELQGGMPVVTNNNIHSNSKGNLVVRSLYSEPGRKSKPMAYENPINFRNNWWGTTNEDEIKAKIAGEWGIEVSINPFATEEIQNAGPDWKEFGWMYK